MSCQCAAQAKMLEAVANQRQAARQLQEAQQAFDGERAHLEQQVRRGKEEGSVRIQTLEDTVRKLGNRSDLHQVGFLCRSQATAVLLGNRKVLQQLPGCCCSV